MIFFSLILILRFLNTKFIYFNKNAFLIDICPDCRLKARGSKVTSSRKLRDSERPRALSYEKVG